MEPNNNKQYLCVMRHNLTIDHLALSIFTMEERTRLPLTGPPNHIIDKNNIRKAVYFNQYNFLKIVRTGEKLILI